MLAWQDSLSTLYGDAHKRVTYETPAHGHHDPERSVAIYRPVSPLCIKLTCYFFAARPCVKA